MAAAAIVQIIGRSPPETSPRSCRRYRSRQGEAIAYAANGHEGVDNSGFSAVVPETEVCYTDAVWWAAAENAGLRAM